MIVSELIELLSTLQPNATVVYSGRDAYGDDFCSHVRVEVVGPDVYIDGECESLVTR